MKCCDSEPREYFLCGMRLFFGVWLLYAGLFKWVVFGPAGFAGFITSDFDKTWSPHLLNLGLAWLILFAEPLGALWLLSGKCQRMAWSAVTLLMFMLMFGQTLLMKPEVAYNWMYTVLTLVCAALSEPKKDENVVADALRKNFV